MIVSSDVGGVGGVPARRPGCRLVASIDVEWTKNYKVPNGNVPFCWSVIWLQVSRDGDAPLPEEFTYTSAYVSDDSQTQKLIATADTQIGCVLEHADVIVGHQVSSDIAVLRNNSTSPLAAVGELRDRWHGRRHPDDGPVVVDTRYDVGGIVLGTSRRLVDVCGELGLDVTQPELRGTSMTALHRRWLERGDVSARERITVLNFRHSLSAGYVALLTAGLVLRSGPVPVNQILDCQLCGKYAWLDSPAFRRLLSPTGSRLRLVNMP